MMLAVQEAEAIELGVNEREYKRKSAAENARAKSVMQPSRPSRNPRRRSRRR